MIIEFSELLTNYTIILKCKRRETCLTYGQDKSEAIQTIFSMTQKNSTVNNSCL